MGLKPKSIKAFFGAFDATNKRFPFFFAKEKKLFKKVKKK